MTARTLSALVLALAALPVAVAEALPWPASPGPPQEAESSESPTLTLTLSQAVEHALGRTPTVGRARETINEFNLQVRQVRADALRRRLAAAANANGHQHERAAPSVTVPHP